MSVGPVATDRMQSLPLGRTPSAYHSSRALKKFNEPAIVRAGAGVHFAATDRAARSSQPQECLLSNFVLNIRGRLLASATLAALIASGSTFVVASIPAHAGAVVTADLQNPSMPSFANVVEHVKPAVSVKMKIENAAARSDDAADMGLAHADVIVEVAGKPASQPADVKAGISAAKKAVLMKIETAEGASRFLAFALPKA